MLRRSRTTSAVAAAAAPTGGDEPPPRKRHSRFTILHVRDGNRVALHVSPGGKVAARVGPRTQFGSPETLTVAARRGRWVGVTTSEPPNGRLGWVDERSSALEEHRTQVSLQVDLSS